MTPHPMPLISSLAVGVLALWIPSLVCFFVLEWRGGWLLRALGPARAYLLIGVAYALLAAVPLSTIVSTRRPAHFVAVFSLVAMVAVAVMVALLRVRHDRTGGYIAGLAAICVLGGATCYYVEPHWRSLVVGLLLACWAFVGDYAGYSARAVLGGMRGTLVYATVYSLFLGSGLGVALWWVQ